jgi:tryptophan synthase alpha chain
MTAVVQAGAGQARAPGAPQAPDATASGTNATAGAARIARAFAKARDDGRAALIPYIVAGYPDAETSLAVALAAVDAGADLLEVGLPYSDPLADGATIQRASTAALRNGATFDRSIALIEQIAAARPAIPLVPMAYANQVLGGGDGAAGPGGSPRRAPVASSCQT